MLNSNKYIIDSLSDETIYFELNDNLLIIGLTILCQHIIYKELIDTYGKQSIVDRYIFYEKAENIYPKAFSEYSKFFDHYDKYTLEYLLKTTTLDDIGLVVNSVYEDGERCQVFSNLDPSLFETGFHPIDLIGN